MPKRYKLRGASLDAIREKALTQYGPQARIVAAEKVINPGIVGLFAAARFEATVEVGEAAGIAPAALASGPAAPRASTGKTAANPIAGRDLQGPAIAALLERADAAEREMHRPDPVSTASPDFAGLLQQLGKELEAAPAVHPPLEPPLPPSDASNGKVPAPLEGNGNVILLVGLGDDALGPALEMSIAAGGSDVRTAGELTAFGHLHVSGRQSAMAARAQAVLTGQNVVVAYGLGKASDIPEQAHAIAGLSADQVWVVADARRKAGDTAAWVRALQTLLSTEPVGVSALAVIGASETASPETVDGLGIPVGWVDGKPARRTSLGKVH
ncbi:hypothetical protein IG195_03670 [Arthrobacter sp. TES]|uniref:hypothetical protein n=1 Tax=Paenarthrobacter ureafaciens TaxID=37931 RepID=UPI000396B87D|nr:hypothetical protein ARZXY2_3035 [Arthrobacter sp. ZXY-2]QOI64205.1 hypothetical protein IG195_03670 [Arthrobacter sp. TES]